MLLAGCERSEPFARLAALIEPQKGRQTLDAGLDCTELAKSSVGCEASVTVTQKSTLTAAHGDKGDDLCALLQKQLAEQADTLKKQEQRCLQLEKELKLALAANQELQTTVAGLTAAKEELKHEWLGTIKRSMAVEAQRDTMACELRQARSAGDRRSQCTAAIESVTTPALSRDEFEDSIGRPFHFKLSFFEACTEALGAAPSSSASQVFTARGVHATLKAARA